MPGDYISRDEMIEQTKAQIVLGAPKFNTGLKTAIEVATSIPAADVDPVRHAYWVKRMENGVGRGYEVHTPIWSCSDCGRDYDPASCSIIKYCYICGAKMDGGKE